MSVSPVNDLLQEGLALHRRGAVDEAAARYADVLRADPANADALYYLALISCQRCRFEEGAELGPRRGVGIVLFPSFGALAELAVDVSHRFSHG